MRLIIIFLGLFIFYSANAQKICGHGDVTAPCPIGCLLPDCGCKEAGIKDSILVIIPRDPNLIIGPAGYDTTIKWVSVHATLAYTILFENNADSATGPAQKVIIYCPIHGNINPNSLRLGDFGFGRFNFSVPANSSTYSNRLDVRDSLGVFVDVTAGLDIANRRAFWIFESIDPSTGLASTLAPDKGFLLINDSVTHKGEGYVNFTVLPKNNAHTRDSINKQADIVFDINDPIATNIATNIIDAVAPVSNINSLPDFVPNIFTVSWTGQDDNNGSGVKDYALYYSKNSGPFILYSKNIDSTSLSFTGENGATYSFYTIATDNTGNVEPAKIAGEETVTVGNPCNVIAAVAGTNATCGLSNGSVNLTVTSGTAPYTYLWSNAATTEDLSGLAAGTYSITVTDANGCIATASATITQSPALIATITSKTNVSCNGGSNGSIDLSVSGGTSAYTYLWSNTATTQDLSGLAAGTYSVTVTDAKGCTATASATITQPDALNTSSTIANSICGNATGSIDLSVSGGTASYTYLWSNGATTQDLSGLVPGTYSVTVTDAKSCTVTSIYNITSIDNQNPTISCPASIIQSTTSGCSKSIITSNPVYGDNCSVTSLTWIMTGATLLNSAGTGINFVGTKVFNVGITTVTYTVKDVSGNTSACSYTVTLTETKRPTISCPANITLNAAAGLCSQSSNVSNPVINDNCGVTSVTWVMSGATTGSSLTSGINYIGTKSFNVGITTITYTAKDASNNSAVCNFTVTVIDNQNPIITCPANIVRNVTTGCNENIAVDNPVYSDNCSVASLTWKLTGATTGNSPTSGINFIGARIFNMGVTTVAYTAKDPAGNTVSCSFTITVNENIVPTITCPVNITENITKGCTKSITVPNPVYGDNCTVSSLTWTMTGATSLSSSTGGINLVNKKTFNVGITTITYTVKDQSGNNTSCSFTVTVIETIKPTITCPAPSNFCQAINNTYVIPLPTASDNCGIASVTYIVTGATIRNGSGLNASGIFNVGVSTITWTVKDASNNTSTCQTTVTVASCFITLANLSSPEIQKDQTNELIINIKPNPSSNFFTLTIESSDIEKINIKVYDLNGRNVQQLKGLVNQSYRIGDLLIPGMYLVEVRQGKKRVANKIIKL